MKAILTILSILIINFSFATTNPKLKIGFSGNTTTLEVRLNAVKASDVTFTITNAVGVIVNTKITTLKKGSNNISLLDIINLEEGTYTVSLIEAGKTFTTQFVNFK
ncbi:MAG: hypothetical protein HOO89_04515 [Ferruginibacter sp.]|nr:hypothetical protein [Ferruginibacter sp.]